MAVNAYATGFPPNINTAWQYATGDADICAYQSAASAPLNTLDEVDQIYYRSAMLMNRIHEGSGVDRVLKTHHANIELDRLLLIPPRLTKGALYVVRDPRAVACSLANHTGLSIDDTIKFMGSNQATLKAKNGYTIDLLMSWSTHVDSWTLHKLDFPVTVVKYEDLLGNPIEAWAMVFRSLGIEPDAGRLATALERTRFEALKEQEDEHGFKENGKGECFFRKGKADSWMTELTEDQVKRIEENHRQTMTRMGYEPEFKRVKKSNTFPRMRMSASATVK